MKIFYLLLLTVQFAFCDINRPVLNTPLGQIRGSFKQSVGGRQYAAFEGIPYAKPPLKKWRFREPRPIKYWEGTLEARFLYTCIQYNHYIKPNENRVIGDEDCLYLNVYSPQYMQMNNLLDVIIYIHGGAFMFGSGHTYAEKIIMDRNVVFVTLNYRLGPFGFLSTEDQIVPGNNGLKDQVLALKWIKNNIQHFGGNPESITLTGMSAGGASVHLHYISAESNGLFHRGFSLSGTALNPWVLQENPLDKARKLAADVDCNYRDLRTMMHCLNHIPAKVVVKAVENLYGFLNNPFSPFGVVIEPANTLNPFLSEHPFTALKNGNLQDLPWITSVVQAEGLYPAAEFISDPNYLTELERKWHELVYDILDCTYTSDLSKRDEIAQKVKDFYLNGKQISKDTFNQLVQMIGDRLFVADSQMSARLHANISTNPVYYYYFTYRGANSKSKRLSNSKENFGAAHGDDTVYVLSSDVDSLSTENDRQMSKVLLDLWISYAKNGIPLVNNTTWQPVSKNYEDPLNYLEIKSPISYQEVQSSNFGNATFWHSLRFRENENFFQMNNIKDEL